MAPDAPLTYGSYSPPVTPGPLPQPLLHGWPQGPVQHPLELLQAPQPLGPWPHLGQSRGRSLAPGHLGQQLQLQVADVGHRVLEQPGLRYGGGGGGEELLEVGELLLAGLGGGGSDAGWDHKTLDVNQSQT